MGAMIMFGLITIVAFCGGGYYYVQDRKMKRHTHAQK